MLASAPMLACKQDGGNLLRARRLRLVHLWKIFALKMMLVLKHGQG
jgi:hypothetical protein